MHTTIFYNNLFLCTVLTFFMAVTQAQDAPAIMKKGIDYIDQGNYPLAVTNLTKAINMGAKALGENYSTAFFYRGVSYVQTQKWNLALKDFTKAISSYPGNNNRENYWEILSDYYYNRGYVYEQTDEIDLALKDFSDAIRLNPKNTAAFVSRGIIYYTSGQYNLAIPDYTRAIELDSTDANNYTNRHMAYYNNGQTELAMLDISKAIALNPDYAGNYNNRGHCYTELGNYEQAAADFKSCYLKDPAYGLAYINAIAPLIRLQRFDEAKAVYDRYKELNLTSYLESPVYDFYIPFINAVKQVVNGMLIEAMTSLNIASDQYGPELKAETKRAYIDILFLKGYILEKQNRDEDATIVYQQSLTLDNKQPDLTQALQRIQKKKELAINAGDTIPPEIILKRPVPTREFDIVSDNPKTIVTGRVKDLSGIASLTINDLPVTEEDGFFDTELELKTGANSIVIKASDKRGNTATKTFIVTGVASGAAVTNAAPVQELKLASGESPNFYAIFIAANKYKDDNINDLENPVTDAETLRTILEKEYIFDSLHIDTLYNRNRLDILTRIASRSAALKENDNLLIFFAGHGTATVNNDKTIDGFLIPSDATKGLNLTYIANSDIRNLLKNCNAKHVLMITDACFSGALTRSLGADATTAIKLQYESMSRKVMSSGNMTAVPDKSKFIEYLIKRLKQNTEKYLSAKKLFDSFYENVMNETDPPTAPMFRLLPGLPDDGGEFIFIKR